MKAFAGKWLFALVTLAVVGPFLVMCDEALENALEEAIGDDTPTALRESALPNCSRAVNCCNRLGSDELAALVPETVSQLCTESISAAATSAIDEFQRERDSISNQGGLTDARRTALLNDLEEQWQDRVEPGCRCFTEQTVGQIPDLVSPADCEPVTSTGSLEAGATCSSALDSLTNLDTTE